jgi:hypothetical protein
MFLGSEQCRIATSGIKLQPMLTSQPRNKLLIRVRLCSAQLVIEVNDGENDAKVLPQFEQKAKQSNRIDPAGNCNADAVPGPQQFLPADMNR